MSNQLIEAQRYEMYLGLKRKWSLTKIAGEIAVAIFTICREVKRNAKPDEEYVWKQAQSACESCKHGFKGNYRKPSDLWWKIDCMIHEKTGHLDRLLVFSVRRICIYASKPFLAIYILIKNWKTCPT